MEWRMIEGSNGEYFITKDGQIRRNNLLLKPSINGSGYYIVNIRDKSNKLVSKLLHRLIAIAFIPNPENLPVVNHINGIKTDNRINNLEWVTFKGNIRKAWDIGLCSSKAGDNNGHATLTEKDVLEIRSMFDIEAVAKSYGVKPVTISDVLLRHSWKHI